MVLIHVFLGVLGLFSGIVIASGVIALLIGLNIIPRYAGITHTADKIVLYENSAMAGAFVGNLITLFPMSIPIGGIGTGLFGLFGGIFLGSWIMALTEMLDIVPIMARRIGLICGMGFIVLSTAIGKTLWSMLFYYKRW